MESILEIKNKPGTKFISRTVSAFLLFLFTTLALPALDLSDSAITYYEKKEYTATIRCYEKILTEGKDSWILRYNLGNAYFKNNQLGKAILNYEIAAKLNPAQEDIAKNLEIAESKLQDKMELKDNFFQTKIRSGLTSAFTTSGWAWLSICLFTAGLAFIFLFSSSQKTSMRRLFFWLGLIAFILFIPVLPIGYMALHDKSTGGSGVITAPLSVNVFKDPGTKEKQPFQLHEGTRVKVLNTEDDWVNIQLQNGNEGWIKKSDFEQY